MRRTRLGCALRRRYGRSIDHGIKPTPFSGTRIASRGTAHVTKESDGLYYTWDRGNWILAFKSKKKAMDHMKVLAETSARLSR